LKNVSNARQGSSLLFLLHILHLTTPPCLLNLNVTRKKPNLKPNQKVQSQKRTTRKPPDVVSKKTKNNKKKRKASVLETMTTTNGDDNENSLELDKEKKNKKKKAKSEEEFVVMENKVEDPNGISKFKISEPLREKLKEKGIESLFPIQAVTFDIILQGCDLVGRARTGQVRCHSLNFFSLSLSIGLTFYIEGVSDDNLSV